MSNAETTQCGKRAKLTIKFLQLTMQGVAGKQDY